MNKFLHVLSVGLLVCGSARADDHSEFKGGEEIEAAIAAERGPDPIEECVKSYLPFQEKACAITGQVRKNSDYFDSFDDKKTTESADILVQLNRQDILNNCDKVEGMIVGFVRGRCSSLKDKDTREEYRQQFAEAVKVMRANSTVGKSSALKKANAQLADLFESFASKTIALFK